MGVVFFPVTTINQDVVHDHLYYVQTFENGRHLALEYLGVGGNSKWQSAKCITSKWCNEGSQQLAVFVDRNLPKSACGV